ncbi:hypothetical protein FACS189498_3300 [Spirochaetia bacterium]|nr:hypothetical protein FACS189498_3300 [Spirochaetia bacterium]
MTPQKYYGKDKRVMSVMVEAAVAKLPSAPKLILAFPPLIVENAGDEYIFCI